MLTDFETFSFSNQTFFFKNLGLHYYSEQRKCSEKSTVPNISTRRAILLAQHAKSEIPCLLGNFMHYNVYKLYMYY